MVRGFLDPHEVPPPPGTEGWEKMYPYYYRFVPKGVNAEIERYESEQMWVCDTLHQRSPLLPFDSHIDDYWWPSLSQMNTRILCFPTAAGVDHRMLYGWVYLAFLQEKNPEIVEKKSKVVQERIRHYYENWDKVLELWKKKQYENAKSMDELRFGNLPEMVDDAYILKHVGYSPASEMRRDYFRMLQIIDLAWEYHFELLTMGFYAYVSFHQFCKQAFPDITDITIGKMCSGNLSDAYLPELRLQELARLALELGIANSIMESGDAEQVEARLKKRDGGRKWIEEYDKFRDPYFYIGSGSGLWTHTDISWNDDFNLPLAILRDYLGKLQRGEPIGRDITASKREADALAEIYRGSLTTEEDRNMFDRLLPLARRGMNHSEGHMFWGEAQYQPRMFNKLRQLGEVFSKFDMLDEPNDLFYLNRFEIPSLIHDLTTAWADRTKARATWYWKPEIKWRKEVYRRFREWDPPPFLGTAREEITDPIGIGLWGITKEKIDSYLARAEVKSEEVDELTGFPASIGVIEGKARVLHSADEIGDVRNGEIMVVRLTSPTWGPAFGKIGACVTDIGGMLSHAAIICREYGLPAVTGAGYATKAIKSGDVIRIDGGKGTVTIIKRAKENVAV